jgi:DNA-binding CsgD family transcriptional regulator
MYEDTILAIGTNQFSKMLFAEAQRALSLRQLVAYRFRPDTSVELLMAESTNDDGNMHRVIRDFSRSLYKRDPIRNQMCPAPVRQLTVHHIKAETIPDVMFRDTLYRTQRMASKTAIVVQRPSDVLVIGFFRGEDTDELSGQQWEFIERSAGTIAAAVERHCDLITTPMTIDWASRLQAISDRTALSRQEIAVCTQILEGYFNEAVAINMGLSVHSVITYRRRAFAKLGITTQSELFAIALRSRLH